MRIPRQSLRQILLEEIQSISLQYNNDSNNNNNDNNHIVQWGMEIDSFEEIETSKDKVVMYVCFIIRINDII